MKARVLLALVAGLCIGGCADLPGWMIAQRRSAITDYQHFDNAAVRAARPGALPSAPAGALKLPQQWAGVPFEQALAQNQTVALLVVQHGQVAYERYFDGYQRDSTMTSFSVAKSVVSALLGIAIGEGRVQGVDEPVTRYLPELAASDKRFEQVTLRHLLEMRSGLDFDEGYNSPFADASKFYLNRDIPALVRRLRLREAPDQRYHYASGNTQLLGMVIERATGQRLAQYLEQKIWQPMGAEFDASWSLDSAASGTAKGFCCLNARAIDYARFGEVFLHQGQWNGQQIVPRQWVADSLEVRQHEGASPAAQWNVENPGTPAQLFYTWQWRRQGRADQGALTGMKPAPSFFAQGLHGQYIYVAPEADMVIVRLGRERGQIHWPSLMAKIAEMNP